MDEETAKTKWCPFVRHSTQNQTHGGADPGINRYGAGVDFNKDSGIGAGDVAWNKCVGSACMAWRWRTLTVWPDDPAKQPTAYEDETDGYCGLAGKP